MLSMGAGAQTTKNYATTAVAHSTAGLGSYNVPDYLNASDGNESTSATLESTTAVAGLFPTHSFVEIGFGANVPAGSMIYIPVQDNSSTGILNTLLSGSIGNILSSLLSDQSFIVDVKKANGNIVASYNTTASQTKSFSGGDFNIVRDANNQLYITFIPNAGADIRSVRVNARTGGLVGASYTLKVQDAYYLSGPATPCSVTQTTAFDATGATLSLLTANGNPVQNPQFAIDADTTNFSTFGYGVANVNVGATYIQDIYFSNLSSPGDQVKIKFRVPPALLNVSLLQNINIRAYKGNIQVFSGDLNSLLSVDLLGLLSASLNNNLPGEVPISVGDNTVQFDRIRVSMTQLLNLNASQLLQLYSVKRVPAPPTVAAAAISSCPGTGLQLAVTNPAGDLTYTWYNSNNTVAGTGTTLNVVAPANGLTNNYTVAASRCTDLFSAPSKVAVSAVAGSCVAVAPVAFLAGAYSTSLSRHKDVTNDWATLLQVNATNQPYNVAPFNYTGTESVALSVFTNTAGTDDILDWVLLELKDSTGNLVDRHVAFVLENGNIVNLDKTAGIAFKANAGRYHLTVRHRNHLGLSTELMTFVPGSNGFNFGSATDATLYGTAAAFTVIGGKVCLIGGNANGNGNIRYNSTANDRDAILAFLGFAETGITYNVYTPADVNLDGVVRYNGRNNDRDFLLEALNFNETGFTAEQIK
ncbi:hypothetical protein [Taibaiella chishuiensis]|nr:hypothetical protein [Taibaiella chishuiensis]